MDKNKVPRGKPPPTNDSKREKAREVVDILQEISILLKTDLDRAQLSLCVSLIENGVNPEALANAIKDLRAEAENLVTTSRMEDESGALDDDDDNSRDADSDS